MSGAARYRTRDMALIAERARPLGGLGGSNLDLFLPLDDAAYAVLQEIGGKAFSAVEVTRALGEIADGDERIPPPALHAALVRLIDLGLLEERTQAPGQSPGSAARSYHRTPVGEAVLLAESGRRRRSGGTEFPTFLTRGRARTA